MNRKKRSVSKQCIVQVDGLKYGDIQLLCKTNDPLERLSRLHNIRDKRLAQPFDSVYRMTASCELLPDRIEPHHGYHAVCYQRFTANLDRLHDIPESLPSTSSRLPRSSKDKVLFHPDCIFCGSDKPKKLKKQDSWTTEKLSVFEKEGWRNVLDAAERKCDETLLRRIRGHDLFAVEAKYHCSCRCSYIQNPSKWRSQDPRKFQEQREMEQSHEMAFREVCKIVDKEIIHAGKVLKLDDLRQTYERKLAETEHANPNFRGERLKEKLCKQDQYMCLRFCHLGPFQSYIVYHDGTSMDAAIKWSYQIGCRDVLQDVGTQIHQEIREGHTNSQPLTWPPSAHDLQEQEEIPPMLHKLLCYIICGKASLESPKQRRLVSSIAQDVCRAATNGEWKQAKHILLSLTLRHLFRSEQLTTLLNRLGHSESYSFSLELETAIAEVTAKSSNLLSQQIIRSPDPRQSLFHSEFDNFDQLVNSLTGSGSVHTAHGIMLQEVLGEVCNHASDVVTISRSSRRSLDLEPPDLPDVYVSARKSPVLTISQHTLPEGAGSVTNSRILQMLWFLLRMKSDSKGVLPGWSGFISETGSQPQKLTTIDYYPVIPNSITEYRTVAECHRYAEKATDEVQQNYVITTFDLGVCMKAYPLVWNNVEKYQRHIILVGSFHAACAYLKMIGKKMRCSGLEDVMIEAGLIGSRSLEGVMTGRHYARSINCHKVMYECLERLLLQQCLSRRGVTHVFAGMPEGALEKIDELVQSPSPDNLRNILEDVSFNFCITSYLEFREAVKNGLLGKTAVLWLSYMDHVAIVLSLLEAVQTNNFFLYAQTLHEMADLFFAFGGQNYARYLSFYALYLANIENSHPGATDMLRSGAISVARSFIPGNRAAVDKTMEETFMRHAKSRTAGSGLSGLVTNHSAYQRWIRTTHARSQYTSVTLQMAGMKDEDTTGSRHRDTRNAEKNRSEASVRRAVEAVQSFINPFDVDNMERLLVLSSGAMVPDEMSHDILNAEKTGRAARETFVTDRLERGQDFFQPIRRANLKSFADINTKPRVSCSQSKVLQYREQSSRAFQILVQSQKEGLQVNLEELMSYPLTCIPYSIGLPGHFLVKTDKSKLLHKVSDGIDDAIVPPMEETLWIYDGNATFHSLKDIPGNFRQICRKIFNSLAKGDVVFSTDTYLENSIKSMERRRRGLTEKLILGGGATKKPSDWKKFLSNDENKTQLIELLLVEWKRDEYAPDLHGRRVLLICSGKAYVLGSQNGHTTTLNEVTSLHSSQEETDTRIILYVEYARTKGYGVVRIRSPDSDVFFLLLHYACSWQDITVLFDTGVGNKKRLLDVTGMAKSFTPTYCSALLGLHAFTGCDTTSAFKGRAKLRPLKTMKNEVKYQEALSGLGDHWSVADDQLSSLETFTCAIYGHPHGTDVDALRFMKINDICGNKRSDSLLRNFDMASLPPCKKSLHCHIDRVNYQVAIWKRSHVATPDIPGPERHGWICRNGLLVPHWFDGEEMPAQLPDSNLQVSSDEESEIEVDTDPDFSSDDE